MPKLSHENSVDGIHFEAEGAKIGLNDEQDIAEDRQIAPCKKPWDMEIRSIKPDQQEVGFDRMENHLIYDYLKIRKFGLLKN